MGPLSLVQDSSPALDFEALIAVAQPALLRLARRLVWDAEEARDLVQSALTEAYEKRSLLRDPAAAPAWLRRILVHRAINHLRRRHLWKGVRDLLHLEPSPAPAPDAAVGRAEHLRALAEGLRALPARQSAAFTLRYLEGLSIDEVALAMDIDRGTVRVHLQRALTKLRADGLLSGDLP